MTKRLTSLLLIVMLFTVSVLAQDFSVINKKPAEIAPYSGRGILLWDNWLPATLTGIVSSQYGGLTPPNDIVQCAEDFVVPAGETWQITEIRATGFYSAGVATSFGIDFLENNAGVPGALIESRTIAPTDDPVTGTFSAVVLTEGTYWVSIYAMHGTASTLAEFRWNWYASGSQIGSEPFIQDLGGFFGTPFTWTPFSGLGLTDFLGLVFELYGNTGLPCPVGDPSNPLPSDGATGVSLSTTSISWTNPAEATSTTLWFGTDPFNLTDVQSGSLSTSWAVSPALVSGTTYYWAVQEHIDTCSKLGPTWSFTMESTAVEKFFDDFEANTDSLPAGWVVTNDGGTGVWGIYPNAIVTAWPNAYTLPCGGSCGKVLSADADYWGDGSTLLSTATIDQTFDATDYTNVSIEFDNDVNVISASDFSFVEVSTDGGANWGIVWQWGGSTTDLRNSHEVVDISSVAAGSTFQVRFRSVQPDWDWWWTIDNVGIYCDGFVPVELTSFAASVIGGQVNLNWQTATETNNYGFEVERKQADQQYSKVGFVAGFGTTTETKNYNFVDNTVTSGSFTYRLKQVDLDGTTSYSSEVNVDLNPSTYSLNQNYPNPFNPSTKIDFSLASDSKVTLKIFDVLGQEVMTLINGNLSAGAHIQNFNASSLNSGVYFYTIEAVGVDGTNFNSTKKMILTK